MDGPVTVDGKGRSVPRFRKHGGQIATDQHGLSRHEVVIHIEIKGMGMIGDRTAVHRCLTIILAGIF